MQAHRPGRRHIWIVVLAVGVVVAALLASRSCEPPAAESDARTGAPVEDPLKARPRADIGAREPRGGGPRARRVPTPPAPDGGVPAPRDAIMEGGFVRKENRFEVPLSGNVSTPDGPTPWELKNLGFHPFCVTELPGSFVAENLSLHAEVVENGTSRGPSTACPMVRIDSTVTVALLPLPRPPERATLRLTLKKDGDMADSVELTIRSAGTLMPDEAQGQIERLAGFSPKSSVLNRAYLRRLEAGSSVEEAVSAARESLGRIAELLQQQYAVENALDAHDRKVREEILPLIQRTQEATERTLDRLLPRRDTTQK